MNICHMTSAHNSDDVRILKKQCVSLAKNGNNVVLVAQGDSYKYKGVYIKGVGEFHGGRLKRVIKISRAVYKEAKSVDADVYELHDPELLLYVKRLKKLGKKVIFDSHENYQKQIMEKQYIPKRLRAIVKWIYSIIENNACKYLDAALFPDDENPYKGRVDNCVTIYNTPDLDEFEIKTPFEEKENKVCCIGSLTESRGITQLIDACYEAGVKLILGGEFSPKFYEQILKQKKEYSIVEYKGYCKRDEVIDIYNECLIGADTILPVGQYDCTNNLSTKVYEYMAMGIPYITSNFRYNMQIIDDNKCGIYVDPSDSSAIAAAIKKLILHKDLAKEMGYNGKRVVEKEFNWKNDEKRLLDLYEKLYSEES